MRFKNHFIYFLFLVAFLPACKKGFISIEKSDQFIAQKSSMKTGKIIYLDPQLTSYKIREEVTKDFMLTEGLRSELVGSINENAKKNNINIEIFDTDKIKSNYTTYLNSLLRLQNQIDDANELQNNPLNYGKNDFKGLKQKVFVSVPRLTPEFSSLSKEFNTPYFGLCGIFAVDAEPRGVAAKAFTKKYLHNRAGKYYYFYNIIVNVETSEITYRELKRVSCGLDKMYLSPIVYDSFFFLKMNLQDAK